MKLVERTPEAKRAYFQGYAAGAAKMQEEAAKAAEDAWALNDGLVKSPGWDSACLTIKDRIRALNVSPTSGQDASAVKEGK